MSASLFFARTDEQEEVRSTRVERKSTDPIETRGWDAEDFARQQVRGLVHQVFFSNNERRIRQVVFSGLDHDTDVRSICRQVGEALALETCDKIALVGSYPRVLHGQQQEVPPSEASCSPDYETILPKRANSPLPSNLCLVDNSGWDAYRNSSASLHLHLGEVRRKFEYTIIETPPVADSNRAIVMAQFADGIILVLSASHTRRMAARKIKESLENARVQILGTVLSDRLFPIPYRIYRRL